MEENEKVILHVIVVGFHHKKGYQVEFSHPPWPTGDECPPEWSHLPSIAMPDGSHNYHQETVYFHLPPIDGSDTVYGVSCYRQIDANRVLNRTEDITRHSVQKSVVVLSRLPLYGQIQVKLELITTAYFETGDFSKVDMLKDAYSNLNNCLSSSMLHSPQVFVGLSVRDLVLMFRHKLLVLFKLLLLERRVLLTHSPVGELCAGLLALVSLLPEMVPAGLRRAALQPRPPSRRPSAIRSNSAPTTAAVAAASAAGATGVGGVPAAGVPAAADAPAAPGATTAIDATAAAAAADAAATAPAAETNGVDGPPAETGGSVPAAIAAAAGSPAQPADPQRDVVTGNSTFYRAGDDGDRCSGVTAGRSTFYRAGSEGDAAADRSRARSVLHHGPGQSQAAAEPASCSTFYTAAEGGAAAGAAAAEDEPADQQGAEARLERLLAAAQRLDDVQCGMPLRRFRKGHICHPYLSLSDIHLLSDPEVLTFLGGATNVLYSHKRHLVDAYVTMAPCSVELSPSLRRQLALSTEDLRLADLLVRAVTEPASSGSLPELRAAERTETAPRGSDAWLRSVFRLYLYMMLRTSLLPDGSAEHALYNSYYIAALKETPSYVQWADGNHLGVLEVNPGHPCSGQLSMADMKLKISQTFQSSERGRKVTQVAAMTGRAVGGALTVARGALSSWWSSLATPEEATPPAEPAAEATPTDWQPSAGASADARAEEAAAPADVGADETAGRGGRPLAGPPGRRASGGGPAEIASCHGRSAGDAACGQRPLAAGPGLDGAVDVSP